MLDFGEFSCGPDILTLTDSLLLLQIRGTREVLPGPPVRGRRRIAAPALPRSAQESSQARAGVGRIK